MCGDIGVGGCVWGYWCRWRCVGDIGVGGGV